MANTITDPTYVQALPNSGAELEIGHVDTLSRPDVINRPTKGAVAALHRLIESMFENATLDLTDLATFTAITDSMIPPLYLTNKTGGTLAAGDAAALDTANDKAVKLGDTVGSLEQFVVARESIANNASGRFAYVGVMTVNSTGTIARGQYIKKSATTKVVEDAAVAQGSATAAPAGAVGLALTAAAAGVVTAFMFGQTVSAAGTAGISVLDRVSGNTTLASSTTETTVYTKSIPGNTLSTNVGLRLTIFGTMQGDSAGDCTTTFRLKYGATTLTVQDFIVSNTTAPGAVGASTPCKLVFELRGDGATNAQIASALALAPTCPSPSATPTVAQLVTWLLTRGTSAEDSTAAKNLVVTAKHSVSSATDKFVMESAILEQL